MEQLLDYGKNTVILSGDVWHSYSATENIFFWYSFSWKNEWGITTAKWTLLIFPVLWNILNESS